MEDHKQNAIDELEKAVAAAYDQGYNDGVTDGVNHAAASGIQLKPVRTLDKVSDSKRILWW